MLPRTTPRHFQSMQKDRRGRPRHRAFFPAYMTVEGKQRSALVRDVSSHGALLLTRARPEEGSDVDLQLLIAPESKPTNVKAHVLRVETWGDGRAWWPYSVAVRFHQTIAAHERAVVELSQRQRELGVITDEEGNA